MKPILKYDKHAFLKRFEKVKEISPTMRLLVNEKDNIVWISEKSKQEKKKSNFYAFNRPDYSKLNQLLQTIAEKEQYLLDRGYNLQGIKSFNRNAWLDIDINLSKENKEVDQDLPFELVDFRTNLNGIINTEPSEQNFSRYAYFHQLLEQEKQVEDSDSFEIRGRTKKHTLGLTPLRRFVALKFAYKCEEQLHGQTMKASDFKEVLDYAASLIFGYDHYPYRDAQALIGRQGLANWKPERPVDIMTRLNDLCDWVVGEKAANMHPIEKAAIFHAEFLKIHPFLDGNGRTDSVMTNFILMENEMPTIPIRYKNFDRYFQAIDKAIDGHNVEDLVNLFYDEVYSSAQSVNDCLDYIEKTDKPTKEREL